jgi:hypothetical protein
VHLCLLYASAATCGQCGIVNNSLFYSVSVNEIDNSVKVGTGLPIFRHLHPENTSLNLKTLSNAAEAMGKHLELRLV